MKNSGGIPSKKRNNALIQKGLLVLFLISLASLVAPFLMVYVPRLVEGEPSVAGKKVYPVEYRDVPPPSEAYNERILRKYMEKEMRVFHVTKEYGMAAMGGLGTVLTSLASVQQQNGFRVNILMPMYTYIQTEYEDQLVIVDNLTIDVQRERYFLKIFPYLESTVSKVVVPIYRLELDYISLYFIGAGNIAPFDIAYVAEDKFRIYDEVRGLNWMLRDIYFCVVATKFFQQEHLRDPIDIIQMHGATNALIMPLLQADISFRVGPNRPALIYTIHDYYHEFFYQLEISKIKRFTAFPFPMDPITKTQFYDSLYISIYGIRNADIITCVSTSMIQDYLQGPMDFANKFLVIDDILEKMKANRFFGIPNGITLTTFNPFSNEILAKHDLLFGDADNVIDVKLRAKHVLIQAGYLGKEDFRRPLALYIGRFQHNKGFDYCERALSLFENKGVVFVVMGQRAYELEDLVYKLKGEMVFIDDLEEQQRWGLVFRAAADFIFVPSRTEAFGLVAAEGLLFGSIVISSGVGGLRDFLVDRLPFSSSLQAKTMDKEWNHNAYLFKIGYMHTLAAAIEEACTFYYQKLLPDKVKHEKFLRTLIQQALDMEWTTPGGTLYKYRYVYSKALAQIAQEAN